MRLEQLAARELGLADGEREQIGLDVGGLGGGGGEVEHGVRGRRAARRVELPRTHFKALRRG